MTPEDSATQALVNQAKVQLFDWLMEAIEVHEDQVIDYGADADDELYHVYSEVKRQLQEIRSSVV